ncbi:hypothetical protein SR870_22115 [Rhodopseudomonas palustris]|nr:hypothetical protein [Rhodopseudomonas palustris]WQG99332.1 hypothetical protein SR870_22115 [Rhodopseudomonas palustris]
MTARQRVALSYAATDCSYLPACAFIPDRSIRRAPARTSRN